MALSIDSHLHLYQSSYDKLPRGIKKLFGQIYGSIPLHIRFGKYYTLHKKNLERFESMCEQEKLDYIYAKTYETIHFAYTHIPYYRNLFNQIGFEPKDFKAFDDLKKIPPLTKSDLQKYLDILYTDRFDAPVAYYTGGSSTVPTKLYAPKTISRSKEKAYFLSAFSELGYRYRDRTISLVARAKPDEKKKLYWDYQAVDNYLQLSVMHLNASTIAPIVNEIKSFQPYYFYGYPSAIKAFIKASKTIDEDFTYIRGVILVSESVSPEEIAYISDFFDAPVITHYGHTERIIMARKRNNEPYRFFSSYGLVRIVGGEMVGTSFDNIVMPYINYKTNDYIIGEADFFNGTDIPKRVTDIAGRAQEFVVTKDHRVIPILTIGAGHFNSYDAVEKVQFYQDTPGKVVLKIVSNNPSAVKQKEMVEQMRKQVRNSIDFSIEFVDELPLTERKKALLCVQKLDLQDYLAKSSNGI